MLFIAILYESKFGKSSSHCSRSRFLTYMPTTNLKLVHPWRNYESKHPQMYNVYVSSPTLAHDIPNPDQVSGKWAASEQQVSNPFGPVSYQHVLVISSSCPRRVLVKLYTDITAIGRRRHVEMCSNCSHLKQICVDRQCFSWLLVFCMNPSFENQTLAAAGTFFWRICPQQISNL